jgi:phage-related protein (TIGR01555 family)
VSVTEILSDGWQNVLTGLGTTADKLRSTVWTMGSSPVQTVDELESIYETVWLARRVVQVFPEHALRKRPRILDLPDAESLWAAWDLLNSTELYPHGVLLQSLFQGRLSGGAVLIPGFKFGDPTEPAPAPGPLSEILWLDVVRWQDLRLGSRETDANSPRFGLPVTYTVQGDHRRSGYEFHYSRAIYCEGAPRARYRRADPTPWLSVLEPVIEELKRYDAAWQAIGHLLDEASIGVLKLQGLIGLLGQKDSQLVQSRMNLMTQGRSVARTVFLDASTQEDFTRTEVSFASIPQLLEQAVLQVSGATEIPVALLLGQSPAGLSATGENDRAQFEDRIAVYQRGTVGPKLARLLSWIHGEEVRLEFPPVREMTEAERATLRAAQAQTDRAYFDFGIVTEADLLEIRGADYGIDVDQRLSELAGTDLPDNATIQVPPAAQASVITVNELRISIGLEPLPAADLRGTRMVSELLAGTTDDAPPDEPTDEPDDDEPDDDEPDDAPTDEPSKG